MKNLSDIDDEYNESFEEIVDKFRKDLSKSKNHKKSGEKFNKNLSKILKKRKSQYLSFLKSHKKELLDMPKKKKKKEIPNKIYKAYEFNFNETLFESISRKFKKFIFNFSLFYRKIKYNIVPSKIKFLFFRTNLFLRSLSYDVNVTTGFIFSRLWKLIMKISSKIKDVWLIVYNYLKGKFLKIKANIDARKKKKKEEKEAKLKAIEEAEKAKKKEEKEKKVEESIDTEATDDEPRTVDKANNKEEGNEEKLVKKESTGKTKKDLN